MGPNIRIFNLGLGLSIATAFVYLITAFLVGSMDCVLNSGCSDYYNLYGINSGEALMVIFLGFFWLLATGLLVVLLNRKITPVSYGFIVSTSGYTFVTGVCAASWAKSKLYAIVTSIESQFGSTTYVLSSQFLPSMSALIITSIIYVVFQLAFGLAMIYWKDQFVIIPEDESFYAAIINRESTYSTSDAYSDINPKPY